MELMKKQKRAALQAENDGLRAQLAARNGHAVLLPAAPAPDRGLQGQIDDLKEQLSTLAYLHAEFVQEAAHAVATLVWLHDERGYNLQQFIESENRLIARARAVKAAKTQAEQAAL
jgi:hypothetical protein